MATEASKTKSLWKPEILKLLKGDGIDIGCGKDPIVPQVVPFDLEHGDANHISAHVPTKICTSKASSRASSTAITKILLRFQKTTPGVPAPTTFWT